MEREVPDGAVGRSYAAEAGPIRACPDGDRLCRKRLPEPGSLGCARHSLIDGAVGVSEEAKRCPGDPLKCISTGIKFALQLSVSKRWERVMLQGVEPDLVPRRGQGG